MNEMLTMGGGAAAAVAFSSLSLWVIGDAPGRTVERSEATCPSNTLLTPG